MAKSFRNRVWSLSLMWPRVVAVHLKMMLEFLTSKASFWANLKGSKCKISRSSLISHLSSQRDAMAGWHGAVGLCLEPKEALKQHIDSPHISGKYHQALFMAICCCCDVVLIHSSLISAIDVILDKHNFLKDLQSMPAMALWESSQKQSNNLSEHIFMRSICRPLQTELDGCMISTKMA